MSRLLGALTPIASALAELHVPARPSGFGVRSSGRPAVHEVGSHGSPRWRLSQPWSPDDAWTLDTREDGLLLGQGRAVPEAQEWDYLTFAEGSRAEDGAAVLWALPPGRYLLVRSAREPTPSATLLLGNEHVPRPGHARGLLEDGEHYAAIIGAFPDRPPALSQPLLGLACLEYTGHSKPDAVLFFPCLGERPERNGDLLLVVPVEGELVIDAMADFAGGVERAVRDRWRDGGAARFAAALTR